VTPVELYLHSLAPGSRRGTRWALQAFATALDAPGPFEWSTLDWEAAQRARGVLAERYQPATVNRILAAVRQMMRTSWQMGMIDAERYHRVSALPMVRGDSGKRGRYLPRDERRRLAAVCPETTAGYRDAAAVALLLGCGLRRAELAALTITAFSPARERVIIVGKGKRRRMLPVPRWVRKRLWQWEGVRGSGPGFYFWSCRWGRLQRNSRIGGAAVYQIVQRAARAANITGVTPHNLRRTYCSAFLQATGDLSLAQRLMGHRDPKTTARYDIRPDAVAEAAVSRVWDQEM